MHATKAAGLSVALCVASRILLSLCLQERISRPQVLEVLKLPAEVPKEQPHTLDLIIRGYGKGKPGFSGTVVQVRAFICVLVISTMYCCAVALLTLTAGAQSLTQHFFVTGQAQVPDDWAVSTLTKLFAEIFKQRTSGTSSGPEICGNLEIRQAGEIASVSSRLTLYCLLQPLVVPLTCAHSFSRASLSCSLSPAKLSSLSRTIFVTSFSVTS